MVLNKMESSKQIGNVKADYVASLSEQGLEQLLQNLARKYYQAFVDGDAAKMESTMDFIKDIELIVDNNGYAFDGFINYCMLCNANFIIKTLFKHDIELNPYCDVSISTKNVWSEFVDAFNSGKYSHINGADRINIRNLYQMCKDDPTINAEIMAIVDALHESFIDKEKYKDEFVGGADE